MLKIRTSITKQIKPDWSTAPEWAEWWAVDENGCAYWYSEKPAMRGRAFYKENVESLVMPAFNKVPEWQDSLSKRPPKPTQ
jgi:hypothetical protein